MVDVFRVSAVQLHGNRVWKMTADSTVAASNNRQLNVDSAVSSNNWIYRVNFNHILEPAGKYDLATALKEHRNRSAGMQPIYRYPDFSNSSDFFGGQSSSSQSFMFLLNGLAKSFVSYIDDPDEEINQMMELASKVSLQPKIQINFCVFKDIIQAKENTQNGTMAESSITDSQLNSIEAENRRRANLVSFFG
jgi:hypothetical protein